MKSNKVVDREQSKSIIDDQYVSIFRFKYHTSKPK
jgi:hypothetical protein